MKRLLIVFSSIIAFVTLSFSPAYALPIYEVDEGDFAHVIANDFSVKWYQTQGGFSQEWEMEIQNLQSVNRDFDLGLMIRFGDLSLFQNPKLYEWKLVNVTTPTLISGSQRTECVTLNTNGTDYQSCSLVDDRVYQDVTTPTLVWKSAKQFILTGDNLEKQDRLGVIQIPKYDSKDKGDGTINGTKKFKLTFDILPNGDLTNNAGQFSIIDYNSNEVYHPFWNLSYGYKMPLNISSAANTNLINFPVYVEFDTATPILAGKMNSDCSDFEPINESDLRRDFEFEAHGSASVGCDTGNTSVWEGHPLFEADNSSFTEFYYGDPTDSTFSNSSGLWSGYERVFHMIDGHDSSPNAATLTVSTSATNFGFDVDCPFGECVDIAPVNNVISETDSADHTPAGDFTLEAWVTVPTNPHAGANDSAIVSKWSAGTCAAGGKAYEILGQFSVPRFFFSACMTDNSQPSEIITTDIVDGSPIYLAMVWDNTNKNLIYYINGTQVGGVDNVPAANGIKDSTADLIIGPNTASDGVGVLRQFVDEVRIGNFNGSADYIRQNWIMGCSNRQMDGCEQLLTFGAEEEGASSPVISGNNTYQNLVLENDLTFDYADLDIDFEATVTDADGNLNNVTLEFNGVNYTASNTSTVFFRNFTSQTAGSYNFRWIAMDLDNNVVSTEQVTLTINKATPTLRTFIDNIPGNVTTYNNVSTTVIGNSTAISGTSDITFVLYHNDTQIATGNPGTYSTTFGIGTYNIIYNQTEGANWTSAQNNTIWLTVEQGITPTPSGIAGITLVVLLIVPILMAVALLIILKNWLAKPDKDIATLVMMFALVIAIIVIISATASLIG